MPKLFYSIDSSHDREGNEFWDASVMEEGAPDSGEWGPTVWQETGYNRDRLLTSIQELFPDAEEA